MNLNPFVNLAINIISLYELVVVLYIIIQWLAHFNIINISQTLVYRIYEFCRKAVDPALLKIRKYTPNVGSIDISPIILFLLLSLAKDILRTYFYYG